MNMRVRKTTWVTCENAPAPIALAMIEAKVPGDAVITKMETFESHENWQQRGGVYGYVTAVKVNVVKFLFEWYREEEREEGTVVPRYERRMIG
jgi:hypothetical protein